MFRYEIIHLQKISAPFDVWSWSRSTFYGEKSSPNERPSIEISQNWKGSLNQLSILIAMSFPSTHLDPRLTILSQYSKASVFLKKITILRDFDAIIAICPKKIYGQEFW